MPLTRYAVAARARLSITQGAGLRHARAGALLHARRCIRAATTSTRGRARPRGRADGWPPTRWRGSHQRHPYAQTRDAKWDFVRMTPGGTARRTPGSGARCATTREHSKLRRGARAERETVALRRAGAVSARPGRARGRQGGRGAAPSPAARAGCPFAFGLRCGRSEGATASAGRSAQRASPRRRRRVGWQPSGVRCGLPEGGTPAGLPLQAAAGGVAGDPNGTLTLPASEGGHPPPSTSYGSGT